MTHSEFAQILAAVQRAAAVYSEFTSDDIYLFLESEPREPNMVGKAMAEAHRLGYIEGTGRFVKSKRPTAKGRKIEVWRRAAQPAVLF